MSLVRRRRGLRRTTRLGTSGERQKGWRGAPTGGDPGVAQSKPRARLKPVSRKKARAGTAWKAQKALLRMRSGGRCEVVLSYDELEEWMWYDPPGDYERFDWSFIGTLDARCCRRARDAHHVKKRGQGGEDTLTNLLHVCRACHNQFDAAPQSKTGKLMAEPSADPLVAPRTWVTRKTKWERLSR
jgi:hypothetical protein